MQTLGERYFERIQQILQDVAASQAQGIEKAGERIARSLARGQICHLFGSGHSGMIAREVTARAGGLIPVNQIPDPTDGFAERVSGYAAAVFEAYAGKYGVEPGEVLIIASNSGINAVPVELAVLAKERGMFVIAITNLRQSQAAMSRLHSGKRLYEVVDLVLDNRCEPGDAAIEHAGLGVKVGATSTFAGALLVNLVMLSAIDHMVASGQVPPILKSQNLPGADEWNRQLREKYRARLSRAGI